MAKPPNYTKNYVVPAMLVEVMELIIPFHIIDVETLEQVLNTKVKSLHKILEIF